jgi:hypothetical protein
MCKLVVATQLYCLLTYFYHRVLLKFEKEGKECQCEDFLINFSDSFPSAFYDKQGWHETGFMTAALNWYLVVKLVQNDNPWDKNSGRC